MNLKAVHAKEPTQLLSVEPTQTKQPSIKSDDSAMFQVSKRLVSHRLPQPMPESESIDSGKVLSMIFG